MITPSFALTATERVLPRLALDFTTAVLDPRVTFTRAGNTATVTNSSGNVVPINADLPRFDFDPITLVCKGLLIEEQRTNLFQRSEAFDDAYWTKVNSTVTGNTVVAPDGNTTADTVIADATLGAHDVRRDLVPTASTAYTLSAYFQAAGYNFCSLQMSFGGVNAFCSYNLITGALTGVSGGGGVGAITSAGNGWYRCALTATTVNANSGALRLRVENDGSLANWSGNGTSGISVWGAQLEAGGFATSYIPTTTTSLTRNADVATMTGTNFSDWFNAVEGAFTVWASFYQGGSPSGDNGMLNINNSGNVSGQRITMLRSSSTEQGGRAVIVNTTTQVNILSATSLLANTQIKFAYGYKANDFAFYRDSTQLGTDIVCTIPVVDQAFIGCTSAIAGFMNGHIAQVLYYPQRLLNREVQAISK